jgi:hypothetical protein
LLAKKASIPDLKFFKSLIAAEFFARPTYCWYMGMVMAARMPMMATTIRISIRVKPFCDERQYITIL